MALPCAALLNDVRTQTLVSGSTTAPADDDQWFYIDTDCEEGVPCTGGHSIIGSDDNHGNEGDKNDEIHKNDANDETGGRRE